MQSPTRTLTRHCCGPWVLQAVTIGTRFLGIGGVWLDRLPLRNSRIPFCPVVQSTDGHAFDDWRLAGVLSRPDRLCIRLQTQGQPSWHTGTRNCYGDPNLRPLPERPEPPKATLLMEFHSDRWLALPRLRMRTTFASATCAIDWILERFTWEPGGSTAGLTYIAQRWGTEHGGWECRLDRSASFSTRDAMTVNGKVVDLGSGQPRGGGGPAMDFIHGPRGALCLFREDLTHVRGLVEKRRGATVLSFTDQCWARRARRQSTPWLSVVVCQRRLDDVRAHDLWTRLWDRHVQGLAKRTGIARPAPAPAIFCESWNLGSGRFFDRQAARLPAIADTGVRRVLLHTLPHPHEGRNCCGNYDLSILASEGGTEALRAYTDRAHALGLKVIAWAPGSLHRQSPLLKAHPEWVIRDARGQVYGGGYDCLAALDFGHPEVQAFYVDSLRALHDDGGIDGVWLDSLVNLHFYGVNLARPASAGGPGPHTAGWLRCMRQLSRAGLSILTEGVGPLGLSAGSIGFAPIRETAQTGNLLFAHLRGREHLLYRTSLWARGRHQAAGQTISRELYFRTLAHAAPLALYYDTSDNHNPPPAGLAPPVAIAGYRDLNAVYGQVCSRMQVRQLLPSDAGVLWHPDAAAPRDLSAGPLTLDPAACPGPRILFSFRSGVVPLPGRGWVGMVATDLASGRVVPLREPRLRTRKWSVHVIEARP